MKDVKKDAVGKARILFLVAAGLSLAMSVALFFLTDDKINGVFVGLWVPSILILGNMLTGKD